MQTEAELRDRYADVLADGDNAETLNLLTSLEAAYQSSGPPSSFITDTRGLLADRAATRRSLISRLFSTARIFKDRPLLGVATVLLVLIVASSTVVFAATSLIHVFPPEKRPTSNVVFLSNGLPPPGSQRYRSIDPARAARESGLPVAFLSRIPEDLNGSVGVQLIERRSKFGTAQEQTRSLVRYRTERHTLIVALFELAPSVVRKHPVLLGEHTVRLPNGQDGWTTVAPEMIESHWVTLVRDGYVVSFHSDLSLQRLAQLTNRLSIASPSGSVSTRELPADWPTPLPADTPIPGVDIALIGTIGRNLSSHPPRLTYSIRFGNRGNGHEHNLRVTLVLPRGLRIAVSKSSRWPLPGNLRQVPPSRRYTIWFGAGNGGAGGDLPLVASNRTAFTGGATVVVTWTDHGITREQSFHLPFSASTPDRGR
jgi:hypothetical protein